eukprot:CAMPEP_0201539336 /NCGR_PEP_ID=MMETSP0161_2-20130828/70080_1 /ASSEMBLY_ACC=CAM_ASM_000251 /TAXON_ID=180227 /ORGANISM="Neoparamoeba aestuarina, Strain SoJaBio B1-5/56/2" /LENGTH=818 /DNA_ID=CAMNT_0047946657 /DNA_START=38 /DNA_END=2494 /DNA_ORIENTATION=-
MSISGMWRVMRGANVVHRLPPSSFSQKNESSKATNPPPSPAEFSAGEPGVNAYANPFSFAMDLAVTRENQDVSEEFHNPTKRRKVARSTSSMSNSPSPFLNPAAFLSNLHFPEENQSFSSTPTTPRDHSTGKPGESPRKPIPIRVNSPKQTTPLRRLVSCDEEGDDFTEQFSDQFSQITISDDEGPMDSSFAVSPFLVTKGGSSSSFLNGYHDEHFVDVAATNSSSSNLNATSSETKNTSPSKTLPAASSNPSLTMTRPVHIQTPLKSPSMLRSFSPCLSLDLPKCHSPDYLTSIPTPPSSSPSYRFRHHNPTLSSRDWTKEYQRAAGIKNKTKRAEAIREITSSFCSEAKRIGKIIVEERCLPSSRRSIKTLSGGVGGGEKYVHNSIFFKLAVDNNDLYGGDEHSMKVAGHEMKGIVSYSSLEQDPNDGEEVQFGMTILIDYRGFRMIASSILPISSDTLVYGSCDGGHTVKGEESPYGKSLGRLASRLNLRGHLAGLGDDPKFVIGPCDQEGHLGTDGKLYVIDLARLYPPETPDITKKGSFLYRLLRPEFVNNYEKPLSSDAFSLFGKNGNYEEINKDAREATEYLREQVIPDLAFRLSEQANSEWGDDVRLNQFTMDHLEQLNNELHQAGVNLRYLGRIYLQSTDARIQRLALTEMVARVLKHTLRAKLREPSTLGASPKYEEIAVDFFNNVFGKGFEPEILWSVDIPMALESSFSFAVTFGIREHVDLDLLCARIQALSGVKMTSSGVPSQNSRPFSCDDFELFFIRERFTHPLSQEERRSEGKEKGEKREGKGSKMLSVPEWHCLFQQESYM